MLFGTALEEYRLSLRQQEKSERTIKGYLQDLKFFENWLQQVWNGRYTLMTLHLLMLKSS